MPARPFPALIPLFLAVVLSARPALGQQVKMTEAKVLSDGAVTPSKGQTISKKGVSVAFEAIPGPGDFNGYRYDTTKMLSLGAGDRITLFLLDARRDPAVFAQFAAKQVAERGEWITVVIASVARDGDKVYVDLNDELTLTIGLKTRRLVFSASGAFLVQAPLEYDRSAAVKALAAESGNRALMTSVRLAALETLGRLAAVDREALAALVASLDHPALRENAVRLLGDLQTDPATIVQALTKVLSDKDSVVLFHAVRALIKLNAPVQAAIPGLTELLSSRQASQRMGAASTLGQIGPSAAASVPALLALLKDKDAAVRFFAAEALWKIDPATAKDGVPVLAALLSGNTNVELAIRCLANMGPEARDALPALKQLVAKRPYGAVAAEAVKKIEVQ